MKSMALGRYGGGKGDTRTGFEGIWTRLLARLITEKGEAEGRKRGAYAEFGNNTTHKVRNPGLLLEILQYRYE